MCEQREQIEESEKAYKGGNGWVSQCLQVMLDGMCEALDLLGTGVYSREGTQ